jgi:hypothetical protein
MRKIMTMMIVLLLASCMRGKVLRTEPAGDGVDITGTYRVVLLGGVQPGDLAIIAFLDREGDAYTIVPKDQAFVVRVSENQGAEEAVAAGIGFVNRYWTYRYPNIRISRIVGPGGVAIGYEMRRFYKPFVFGIEDPLTIYYVLEESGKVRVVVHQRPLRDVQGE